MKLTAPRGWLIWLFLLCFSSVAAAQQSLLSDLQRERAKLPTPMSASQIGQLLNTVALQHKDEGWKLLAKPSGNNCPQPETGTKIACDYLVYGPSGQGFDVLRDQEGAGDVVWNKGDSFNCVQRCVDPVGIAPPEPPEPPQPPEPPVDLGPILTRLTVAEHAITLLETQLNTVRDDLDKHQSRLANLDAADAQQAADIARIDAFLAGRPWPTRCFARIASLIPVHCELEQ